MKIYCHCISTREVGNGEDGNKVDGASIGQNKKKENKHPMFWDMAEKNFQKKAEGTC